MEFRNYRIFECEYEFHYFMDIEYALTILDILLELEESIEGSVVSEHDTLEEARAALDTHYATYETDGKICRGKMYFLGKYNGKGDVEYNYDYLRCALLENEPFYEELEEEMEFCFEFL